MRFALAQLLSCRHTWDVDDLDDLDDPDDLDDLDNDLSHVWHFVGGLPCGYILTFIS